MIKPSGAGGFFQGLPIILLSGFLRESGVINLKEEEEIQK